MTNLLEVNFSVGFLLGDLSSTSSVNTLLFLNK